MNEKNRKRRRKRIVGIKICLIGMKIAVFLLIIYLVVCIVSLIQKTTEYTDTNQIQEEMLINEEDSSENKAVNCVGEENTFKSKHEKMMEKLEDFAQQNGFSMEEYPDEIIELLEKNPETEEFVLNYPLKKDTYNSEILEDALNQRDMPLFLQWDSRWGYYTYGDKPMGMTGCGPTCLSMVAVHLLQNAQFTPIYVAEFSQRNGFYVEGTGTAWALMTQGAAEIGLYAREVSLDETLVLRYLAQGKPIIAAMGAGDFTENGHFIVFTGTEDGMIRVNDPNSRIRSEQLWSFEDIKNQIKNMWVYAIR